MAKTQSSILDARILGPAVGGAFKKLDPRLQIKNPVMFVLEVVAALTTVLLVRDAVTGGPDLGFSSQIVLWLWFTLLFANFAEATAEGRGKAQAESLRKTRTETQAKVLTGAGAAVGGPRHAFGMRPGAGLRDGLPLRPSQPGRPYFPERF